MNVLLTGFGPFPGARVNPTGPLAQRLASSPPRAGERRAVYVFHTSYDAIDRELPLLIEHEKPDVLAMFGLAARSRHLRIETCARNVASRVVLDAAGSLPGNPIIAPDASATLPMRVPSQRLLQAAKLAGVSVVLSRNAGSYLCNYLCWRATEAAACSGGPRLAAFVHVPRVGSPHGPRRAPLTFEDLMRAGEAIVQAAVAAARTMR